MADTQTTEEEAASWYELSFSRGLVEPSLIMGVPKTVLVMNGIVAFLFLNDFGFWPIIFVCLLVHFLAIYVCKGDNQFFACLKAYLNEKDYYGT